ncbi:MAG: hypothetical protein IJ711_05480 [Lachnospiraceae bacterium]|nr:hypothetical protein [Lachnospiraceae bacterium]
MLKQKYVFVGKYNNNEVYYNVKEKELYELIPYDKPINISPSIYAFVSSILYAFLQKLTIRNFAVSMKWYVGLNAAFGLILSIVSIKYLEPAMDKALVKVLACQEQSEWKKSDGLYKCNLRGEDEKLLFETQDVVAEDESGETRYSDSLLYFEDCNGKLFVFERRGRLEDLNLIYIF